MDDTTPRIAAIQRLKLMERSSEERFIMGAMMFEAARAMVAASIEGPQNSGAARIEYFRRLYRADLPEHALSKICTWIRANTDSPTRLLQRPDVSRDGL